MLYKTLGKWVCNMENQLHSGNTKLSLVGKPISTIGSPETGIEQFEDIAARLPAILQTTLEVDEIIYLYADEISKILEFDSLHYQHQSVGINISTNSPSHHSCNYRLEINSIWLGELTLTRRNKFSDTDVRLIEDLLCKLIYPLRNALMYKEAQKASLQDKLTGLYNRGAFDNSLKREVGLSSRQHTPLSLIVLDIDHFKAINDNYGHSSGDRALKALADCITETVRQSDITFRYGGEEFTIILSNTDLESAQLLAERVRIAVSQLTCNDGKRDFAFTISAGLAQLAQGEDGYALFDRADKALYKAKKSGRNQTIQAS
jgi:diguanylate cyclase (GGDEF)-like protein